MHEPHGQTAARSNGALVTCTDPSVKVYLSAGSEDGTTVYIPNIYTATWSFPATNKLLIDAAFQFDDLDYNAVAQPGQPVSQISILELSNNFRYSAVAGDTGGASGYGEKRTVSFNYRASVSYVTGSHAFKTGVQLRTGYKGPYNDNPAASPVNYTFRIGVPDSLTLFAYPIALKENVRDNLGLFAQDQWTLKRLTLNLGRTSPPTCSTSPMPTTPRSPPARAPAARGPT